MSECKRDGCNFNEYRDCRGYCSPYCQDLADKDAEIARLREEVDRLTSMLTTSAAMKFMDDLRED